MEIQTLVRTAAIIYSDELGTAKTDKIQRKILESVYVLNGNKKLSIDLLLQEIERNYQLKYENAEIVHLLNSKGAEFSFDEKYEQICLTEEKYIKLEKKNVDIESVVSAFLKVKPKYISLDPMSVIYHFLYDLLNTNIDAYNGMLGNNGNISGKCTIDSKKFSDEDIELINDFLAWDDKEKNTLLFKLISFSIEYSLVSNNKNSTAIENALKNKVFYLDLNVIFRAIGVNGSFRKERTEYFLRKCKEFGQKLAISAYTIEEFNSSVKYHIENLASLSYGKCDPTLFSIAGNHYGFYQFYADWRGDTASKGLTMFKTHLTSQLDVLCEKFNIEKDFRHQLKETDVKIQEKIKNYRDDLISYKANTPENTLNIDIKNIIMIESCRGSQNTTFQETKYYLLSSDQKLKTWDEHHSSGQYVVILPSCWMGLILKYYSRTNDDFTSFLSFLKLPANEPVLTEQELEKVVAAISEYTENFQNQKKIMEKIVEGKFSDVINGNGFVVRENVLEVSRNCLEEEYSNLIGEKDEEFEQLKKKSEIQHLRDSIELKERDLKDEKRNELELGKKLKKLNRCVILEIVIKWILTLLCFIFFVIIGIDIVANWNDKEGLVWFISCVLGIVFLLFGWDKTKMIKNFFDKSKIKENFNKKYDKVIEHYSDCKENLSNLQSKIDSLKNDLHQLETQE